MIGLLLLKENTEKDLQYLLLYGKSFTLTDVSGEINNSYHAVVRMIYFFGIFFPSKSESCKDWNFESLGLFLEEKTDFIAELQKTIFVVILEAFILQS